jgi:cytoskeletal protein CcmA (bactofilin family)
MFRKHEATPPPAPEPPPARRFTDQLDHATVILAGLRIEGDIEGDDSVDIGGDLLGNVRIEGLCRVRESGSVKGSIRARQVLIEGEVEGRDVKARERLELRSHARVRADLDARSVALAEGCEFHGQIKMSGGGSGATTFTEKRSGGAKAKG